MNNSQIISTAMAQSATDLRCAPEDFIKDKNIIVESTADPLLAESFAEIRMKKNKTSENT